MGFRVGFGMHYSSIHIWKTLSHTLLHQNTFDNKKRKAAFLKIDFRTLEIMQCDKGTTVEGRGVMVEGLGWCKVWGLGAADRRNLILNPLVH